MFWKTFRGESFSPRLHRERVYKNILGRITPLEVLFNKVVDDKQMPEQWNDAEIILLHKKGDKKNLDNYRPLSLTSDVKKIFMKILKNRIYNQLDWNQPEEQADFRRGYTTIDHIHSLNQIIERTRE